MSAGLLFPRTVTVKQYKYSSGFWILSNVSSFGSTFGEAEDSRITMQVKVGGKGLAVLVTASLEQTR